MNISGAMPICTREFRGESVHGTTYADRECEDSKSNYPIIEDTYESASVIEQYNNYS